MRLSWSRESTGLRRGGDPLLTSPRRGSGCDPSIVHMQMLATKWSAADHTLRCIGATKT